MGKPFNIGVALISEDHSFGSDSCQSFVITVTYQAFIRIALHVGVRMDKETATKLFNVKLNELQKYFSATEGNR